MNDIWLLAQATGDQVPSKISDGPVTQTNVTVPSSATDANTSAGQPQKGLGGSNLWLMLALVFVVFYFMLFRGPQKKQQQHKQMVQSLQKNDKVRTIGGILGTIVDIKDDEITLKIDESNNTKIKVIASAIGKKIEKDKD